MLQRRLRAAATAVLASAAVIGLGQIAQAQSVPVQVPHPRPSLNLYGTTGLIDLPSAEMQEDGEVSASFTTFGNTTRRNFTFQVLPRLSGTLRYSTIKNRGRPDDPGYDLFDRSFDLRFQLLTEDREGWQPALAVGIRDFLGTGVYSSEYLVATKTVARDFTLTGGIGWGRLSRVSSFSNPFCSISDSFCERDKDFGNGGKASFGRFFRGEDAALFGGVEWRTPIEKLTLKAEYSSDNYAREEAGPESDFEHRSPINFGAEYRVNNGLTIGGYYMFGDTLGFNIALSGNPYKPPVPQNLGAGPVPVNARPADYNRNGEWVKNPEARTALATGVRKALSSDFITLEEMRFSPEVVDVFIINRRINQAPKAIGRTARVLAVAMPYSVQTFRITTLEDGVPTTTVEVDRSELEAQVDTPDAGQKSWESVKLQGADPTLDGEVWRRDVYPLYDWSLAPVPSVQIFGGSEGFRPQLSLELQGNVKVTRGLSFSGRIRQPVLGAFEAKEIDDEDRTLPPVRRNSAQYYSGYNPKLMRLTGDYLFKLNRDIYGRTSAGYLERQFAGLSTEVLWKPVEQAWGLGLELNYVRQRDPDEFAEFTGYEVATGHASLYWNTGYKGIEAQVDAGRYLAGDWGGTLRLTRRFANGWAVGAFVTKTDVSEEDFGEGSFDKGISLSVPLRWSTPFETRQNINGDLRSLSSDGGARLSIANRLYPTIRDQDSYHLERNWGAFWQ